MRLLISTLLSLAAATMLVACASDTDPEPEPAGPPPMPEVDLVALGVRNASTALDGVLAAGQLTPAQMDALHEAGYRSFVNLRVATERGTGWEEEHAAEEGIRFTRLEIGGPTAIDEDHARELRALMDAEPKPMVVYCGSSNRVGALFGLAAYHVDGASAEEAFELGKAAGVTSLEQVVRDQLGL